MTDAEKREAARQFYNKWVAKGEEDKDDRSYWLDILQRIMGAADATDRVEFQKKVIVNGNTKKIDVYIPETGIIIEQKSLGIDLNKKAPQSDGIDLTPYEQAKRYNDNLPVSEKARWIITSNFNEIWIYDMDTRVPEQNITKILIKDLQSHYSMLEFLLNRKVKQITEEMELSLKAGELVGKIHDRFLEQYNDPMAKKTQNSLNILCVRLVFCLYAEDAGLFDRKDSFSRYIDQFEPGKIRRALLDLFDVLNTPLDQREDMYLDDDLAAFPYVNGGLFARENIEIPKITQEIKNTLIESGRFDWSKISPTIFGAVFESTLNPETRRSGGMHYTSIENIHKVIDPLFLDDLKVEFEAIKKIAVEKTKKRKLEEFQDKLASLKFFDPACGSGNFLTETYISLRRLENRVINETYSGQMFMGMMKNPIKISINQFYGIEINDFAVTVAKTALWIAESQMMKETEDIVLMHLDFLPLKTNATIIEGNALQLDWNKIVQKDELSYIMGNPPFVGASMMTAEQKKEAVAIFGKIKLSNSIDYVGAWYHKAAAYMQGTFIVSAFVSTNSITQGEQVAPLWNKILNEYKSKIVFAHRTFVWDSEANMKAHVHCVIIGFTYGAYKKPLAIYEGEQIFRPMNISPYLIDAPSVLISSRSKPVCKVNNMVYGNKPTDDGNFILSPEEKERMCINNPELEQFIHKYIGSVEFINNKVRYCFWLKDVSPSVLRKHPELIKRVEAIRVFRLNSTAAPTRAKANLAQEFFFTSQPRGNYLMVPRVSSQNRRYVPLGFMPPEIIASDACSIIPDAILYDFGVLSSNVHMSWLRTVAGRLKSDYRYSGSIVYNTFPWPTPTDAQKVKIEHTAQGILDARALYPDCSLADLYDPLTMPPELRKAHTANDKAVMQAYGFDIKSTSEADCVARLMRMYQELIEKEKQEQEEKASKGKKKKSK